MLTYFSTVTSESDTTPPVVTNCPESSVCTVQIGATVRRCTWTEPTAVDESGVAPTVVRSHQPGDEFQLGTTNVMYTFIDQADNEAVCTFAITGNAFLHELLVFIHVYLIFLN